MSVERIVKNGILGACALSLISINAGLRTGFATEPPPLAPPSSIAMSLEDLILHFKVFVIVDLFQKIASRQSSEGQDFFALTDVELEILMKEFMAEAPLLQESLVLEIFFCQQILYIHLDATFFRCYRLEVLPGEFEFKTEKISDSVYKEFQSKRGKK